MHDILMAFKAVLIRHHAFGWNEAASRGLRQRWLEVLVAFRW